MKKIFILLSAAMMGLSSYAQMNVTRDDNPLRKLSIA
jgi:carboxyl-terminal processing protease